MRLLPLLPLLLAACATATPSEPKPALWKVADPDTTVYLFGTIHILPDGYAWSTPRIDAAVQAADSLVLEIADAQAPDAAERYRALAASPGLPPLAERIAPEQRDDLRRLMARGGFKPGQLDGLETWAAALALGIALYTEQGVSAANGVETTLSRRFREAGKPIAGLETTAQQLGFFDTLSEPVQRKLLSSIVAEADESGDELTAMADAWSRGDVNRIAMTFDDELKDSPELAEALLRRRNASWAEWVKGRLDQPGTVLVAVGAGHLAGPESVQAMLEANGVTVERVQ